jgi:hypothetical protein
MLVVVVVVVGIAVVMVGVPYRPRGPGESGAVLGPVGATAALDELNVLDVEVDELDALDEELDELGVLGQSGRSTAYRFAGSVVAIGGSPRNCRRRLND